MLHIIETDLLRLQRVMAGIYTSYGEFHPSVPLRGLMLIDAKIWCGRERGYRGTGMYESPECLLKSHDASSVATGEVAIPKHDTVYIISSSSSFNKAQSHQQHIITPPCSARLAQLVRAVGGGLDGVHEACADSGLLELVHSGNGRP